MKLMFIQTFMMLGLMAAETPTIAKDSLHLQAFTFNVYHKNFDVWSWAPKAEFRVNGPIASGSQLSMEFSMPGNAAPWVKFDCKTGQVQKGYWWKTECGARDVPEEKGSTYTGPVDFTIQLRNELAGTNATLFKGRMKVSKVHSNEAGPKAVNKYVYYVEHDSELPIGYIYMTPDSVRGMKNPSLSFAFWVRGSGTRMQPHLFHNGEEAGNLVWKGEVVGAPSCDSEVELTTTHFVQNNFPQQAKWTRMKCNFPVVKVWDKTGEKPGMFGPMYILSANPGDYEFKVLWNNHLARVIKFTVAADGTFDNGLAASNELGSERVIVPVQILGDQDGAWNKDAWKTDAYYGNPLKGFAPVR